MARFRYIVDDVDQAVAFYTSRLGFQLKRQYGPAMAILQREDLELWLAGPPASQGTPREAVPTASHSDHGPTGCSPSTVNWPPESSPGCPP